MVFDLNAGKIAATLRPLHLLFFNKWYFDELYDSIFVRPAVRIGTYLWRRGIRTQLTASAQMGCRPRLSFIGRLFAGANDLYFIMPSQC